ncbi:hypothetical protein [Streptomyces sp. UNOC14_S4]|uniref:hypothetical protein n=1 Tax=Streptomyces sp. UNOC14_S4 TaxID=2872340 RepID=UPI001E5FFC8C|nr:hypothetical protein [Streptomyces sp. UNOC14_S4]MCC3767064.1 hypothetical protein [Streptomyces sp. UNOC14_S4]
MGTVSPQEPQPSPLESDFDFDLDAEIRTLVLESAPRLFAVVQDIDLGDGIPDAEVVAWGLVHEGGRVDVVGIDRGYHLTLKSPERAIWWYGEKRGEHARLVWLARPAAAEIATATVPDRGLRNGAGPGPVAVR